MDFLNTLGNNFRHDILGNFRASRELGSAAAYGYLARKSWALAKAVLANKTITVGNKRFYDTWNA
jgi:hypothetical protein